jgi:hypothetical protein
MFTQIRRQKKFIFIDLGFLLTPGVRMRRFFAKARTG